MFCQPFRGQKFAGDVSIVLHMDEIQMNLLDHELDQQSDLSRRLLHMAILGVPRGLEPMKMRDELLALHALLSAFSALAKSSPKLSEQAIKMALNTSHTLLLERQKRAFGEAQHVL